MGLRAQAETDLAATLEDAAGWGWPFTIRKPTVADAAAGVDLTGSASDIGVAINPETGMGISGRFPSVSIRITSLTAAGLGLPRGVADSAGRPWRITFADIEGTAGAYKVREARPDRALGVVVCLLELYAP